MALCNLLDNALKFTPAGGQVTVGGARDGDQVCLWVEDTGVGIDDEDLPHIFERFYRGKRARTDGSGLGLAIVQSIVKAHGGQVSITSTPETGTRFTLTLPAPSPS